MRKCVVFFLILSSLSYGDQLSDMKKKVGDIEKGIKKSSKEIKVIGQNRELIKKQINDLESELKKIESEKKELMVKISSLSKKIEYSKSNLDFSSKELKIRNKEYNAKLEAWNRVKKNKNEKEYIQSNKRNFKELLYSDLETLEHIRVVQKDIDLVKNDIEIDRREQTRLKNILAEKERQGERKKIEKDSLIAQLNKEEIYHKKNITTLEIKKKNIEKEIERIIIERARQVKNVDISTAKSKIGKMRKPIEGNYAVTFGQKKQGNVISSGIEISSSLGSKVDAAASGKIIYAGKFQGLGKVVMIDYGYNMIGVYGNLISHYVKVGDVVQAGQNIGILGMSTDGKPNLYYELRFNLKAVNPVLMF
ncbi:peptidoglycan DD-metalloendopeptidase family protein [uncultured Ilyobacter sp.]|uniref:murein hydrolase activator EnvC family protein n=1 Tax=uncultured Ilyobacter sp. TaxID=544433 RepID=UPI0029C8C113|nr:peptidoglycan DD-metalloendopeptidase family protein [uncultured Ilyobacter sp.]